MLCKWANIALVQLSLYPSESFTKKNLAVYSYNPPSRGRHVGTGAQTRGGVENVKRRAAHESKQRRVGELELCAFDSIQATRGHHC